MKSPEMMLERASRAANPTVRPAIPRLVRRDAVLMPRGLEMLAQPLGHASQVSFIGVSQLRVSGALRRLRDLAVLPTEE